MVKKIVAYVSRAELFITRIKCDEEEYLSILESNEPFCLWGGWANGIAIFQHY